MTFVLDARVDRPRVLTLACLNDPTCRGPCAEKS